MTASIAYTCSQCRKYSQVKIIEEILLTCPQCTKEWGILKDVQTIFEHCVVCQCRQFYTQKDFNQALGCLIMILGIVLVPWTYGLSLPFFWLIDFIMHRKVAPMAVCYQCGCEFRGFAIPKQLKPFMHHIGVKYERNRISPTG